MTGGFDSGPEGKGTMPRTSDPKTPVQSAWRGIDEGMTIVSELVASVAMFGGAGYGLDRVFHISPILFLCGVMFGYGIWVYMVWRRGFAPASAPRKDEPKL